MADTPTPAQAEREAMRYAATTAETFAQWAMVMAGGRQETHTRLSLRAALVCLEAALEPVRAHLAPADGTDAPADAAPGRRG